MGLESWGLEVESIWSDHVRSTVRSLECYLVYSHAYQLIVIVWFMLLHGHTCHIMSWSPRSCA